MVRLALTRLPKRDAEILLLKYSEDWSYRELAEHLDQPDRGAGRLHRARQKLRDELASLDVTEGQP